MKKLSISAQIKAALKEQGIDWLDIVKKRLPLPDGLGYEVVKDARRNTLYIFYPKQETQKNKN